MIMGNIPLCIDCKYRVKCNHYENFVLVGWGWTCPKIEIFTSTPCKHYKCKWWKLLIKKLI